MRILAHLGRDTLRAAWPPEGWGWLGAYPAVMATSLGSGGGGASAKKDSGGTPGRDRAPGGLRGGRGWGARQLCDASQSQPAAAKGS